MTSFPIIEVAPAEPPVACTLSANELGDRLAQWRALLDRAADRTPVDGGVDVRFPADGDLIAEVARLAVAEQHCCAFFTFTLRIDTAGARLAVRAPAAAEPLVAEVFGGS